MVCERIQWERERESSDKEGRVREEGGKKEGWIRTVYI
jgi:hypothetical protein